MHMTNAALLQNVSAFFAHEPIIKPGSDATAPRTYAVVLGPSARPSVRVVSITRTFIPRWNADLALGALRRAGIDPRWVRPADITYSISDVSAWADYSVESWLRETNFSDDLAQLDASEASCHAANQRESERLAAHPVNVAAIAQKRRQEAVEANQPTADVDAWIVANTKYTTETLAALAKSTRRNVRREARQQMTAARL